MEGQLSDQELSGLLVATDLAQSHGAGTVAVGLLDSASGRCGLAGCLKFDKIISLTLKSFRISFETHLGGELLARSLSSSRLAGGLLGTGHCIG